MSNTTENQKAASRTDEAVGAPVIEEGPVAASSRPLPLDAAHRRAGAVMTERDGWTVPLHYGDAAAEYSAVRDSPAAGLFDLSMRGLIEVRGAEAIQFLNGLITNDVKTLADGAWMRAAFPNVQGRLLASVRVIRQGDAFLFDTEAATHNTVSKTLERFTLAGDFRVRDLGGETACLSVQGARAAEIIRAVFGDGAEVVGRGLTVSAARADAAPVTLMRATHTAEDGFDLLTTRGDAESLWSQLVAAGARPVGAEAQEVLRIEAGVPRYGVDVSETNVVLEAVSDDAVSFTKGCYIGQEIIARIRWRGHVAKKLTGFVFDEAPGDRLEPRSFTGAKVYAANEGREIGRVTSCARSPRRQRIVALGVVKYDYLAAGTEVRIKAGDGEASSAARVTELPLVRGSWFESERDAESNG